LLKYQIEKFPPRVLCAPHCEICVEKNEPEKMSGLLTKHGTAPQPMQRHAALAAPGLTDEAKAQVVSIHPKRRAPSCFSDGEQR
jgi:hypothetical protein